VSNDDCKSSRVVVIMLVTPVTHSYLYLVVLTTGYTDGYAYSTLRVMRDRNSEPEWVQCE